MWHNSYSNLTSNYGHSFQLIQVSKHWKANILWDSLGNDNDHTSFAHHQGYGNILKHSHSIDMKFWLKARNLGYGGKGLSGTNHSVMVQTTSSIKQYLSSQTELTVTQIKDKEVQLQDRHYSIKTE